MLSAIGVGSLDDLLAVPESIALRAQLDVVPALPEYQIARRFEHFAAKNTGVDYASFLGAGSYRHYAPPAIAALAMRGEFLTAYTPYQAEVSQGYLQAIYEWQTYICLLTGMDLANASVYDGATALAEGAIMALNATGRKKVLVSRAVDPNYRAVLKTYCDGLDVAYRRAAAHRRRHDRSARACAAVATSEYAARRVAVAELLRQRRHALASTRAKRSSASDTRADRGVAEALSLAALATAGISGARRSSSARRRASASPWPTAARTSASSLRPKSTCAVFPGGWSARRVDGARPHRLRADAAGARAAHSPRARDLEHLHESSALRTDRDDVPRADGQDRVCATLPRSISSARASSRRAVSTLDGVRSEIRARRSSTSSSSTCTNRRATCWRNLQERKHSRRRRSRALVSGTRRPAS